MNQQLGVSNLVFFPFCATVARQTTSLPTSTSNGKPSPPLYCHLALCLFSSSFSLSPHFTCNQYPRSRQRLPANIPRGLSCCLSSSLLFLLAMHDAVITTTVLSCAQFQLFPVPVASFRTLQLYITFSENAKRTCMNAWENEEIDFYLPLG